MSADARPIPVLDALSRHRDILAEEDQRSAQLEKDLAAATFAAKFNAETISAQASEIRELKSKLARVRPAIRQMFDANLDVMIPTILIRDYCEKCGLRFIPTRLFSCSKCGGTLLRSVRCPFDQPLRDLISDDVTQEELGNLIADVACGDSHLVERDGELCIERLAR